MKQSLIAAIGLLLSSSLFAKDYLISTSKTSLLITANAGEQIGRASCRERV